MKVRFVVELFWKRIPFSFYNAVLILHGTTGNSSNFLRAEFAGELFGKGQLLDTTQYYLIIPDNIGHGQSSKPSDKLRGKFPHYGYADMVEAQYRLLAAEVLYFMGNNPVQRQKEAPTLAQADQVLDTNVANALNSLDANNVLYALEASADYDPTPQLGRIQAPLLAVNFADDLINPPELGILEREIKQVKRGQAVVVPMSKRSRGHGTHPLAAVWREHLAKLLNESKSE